MLDFPSYQLQSSVFTIFLVCMPNIKSSRKDENVGNSGTWPSIDQYYRQKYLCTSRQVRHQCYLLT